MSEVVHDRLYNGPLGNRCHVRKVLEVQMGYGRGSGSHIEVALGRLWMGQLKHAFHEMRRFGDRPAQPRSPACVFRERPHHEVPGGAQHLGRPWETCRDAGGRVWTSRPHDIVPGVHAETSRIGVPRAARHEQS